ncbi:hypothetical protein AAVH_41600 [Aphelenchoides avenae]|nr:hypothetical protein AAVH_41600 [Aphelenchus avenae]
MTPPCLEASLRITETIAAVAGLSLNAILGLLICFRSNQTLRAYSRVLACNCVVDLAFSIIGYAIEMHADLRAGFLIVVNNGLFVNANATLNFVLLCIYLYTVYLTIAIVALPVVYRYCLVCR